MKLYHNYPWAGWALAFLLTVAARGQSSINTLYAFTGQFSQIGSFPSARLIQSGSTFYGTTAGDETVGNGAPSAGTVFKIGTNGTGFTVLYTFTGGTDGANPEATLVLSGTTLYGTTTGGGTSGNGTVFKIGTNGSGFKVLHSFGGGSDGDTPFAGMALSGTTLYGTTSGIVSGGNGTIFKINTDGSGYAVVHSFANVGGGDGADPEGDLILSNGALYGTTLVGGIGFGTVYSFNVSSRAYNWLHILNGSSDGQAPSTGLVLSGGTLYGLTDASGTIAGTNSLGYGTIFQVNTNGSNFAPLYTFTEGADGGLPTSNLVLSGGILYGATGQGGGAANGTVFSFSISSGILNVLHNLTSSNGTVRTVTWSGGNLYGTTWDFGAGLGTLFELNTGNLSFTPLYNFAYTDFIDGSNPTSGLVRSGNMMYGTTYEGGANGYGTVYQISVADFVGRTLYSFTGGNDGAYPICRLVVSGNTLYGTTSAGGKFTQGTVFKVNTDGSGFEVLHPFSLLPSSDTNSDGAEPAAGLVLSGSTLYGTAEFGGTGGGGTLFEVGTGGSGFKVLHPFTGGADGGLPAADLLYSGGVLYGTTFGGGTGYGGTVFSYNTGSKAFTTLHGFNGSDGNEPLGALVLSGKTLYGTTNAGGGTFLGTLFKVNTDKSGFAMLWNFTGGTDGSEPAAGLVLSSGVLYGTTEYGGNGSGTVFSYNIASGAPPAPLYEFTDGYDGGYSSAQLILSNNILFGTTNLGGISTPQGGGGTVFSLPAP